MQLDFFQIFRHLYRKGARGLYFAFCRRPFVSAALTTAALIFVSGYIYSGDRSPLRYMLFEGDEFLQRSLVLFWTAQGGICFLILVAIPVSYVVWVKPVVLSYLHDKSTRWINQWKDVDGRVRRCLISLTAIFASWMLIYVAYLGQYYFEALSEHGLLVTVDFLVWANGLGFLYLWYEMRGRTVRQEHRESIEQALNEISASESADEEIYDLFTPWESRGEALLTNADVTPDEVIRNLELERDGLNIEVPSSTEEQPKEPSELATSEAHDTLVLLGLLIVMVAVPAALFFGELVIGSTTLRTLTSFYLACIVAGTSMGLVATRLASIYIDMSSLAVAAIVLYAALQPAFAFEVLLDDYVELSRASVAAPIVLDESPGVQPTPTPSTKAAADIESVEDLAWLHQTFQSGLFTYSLFGKIMVGLAFLHLLLRGRLHYYIYYLQRSHALLAVHRRLTTKSFPVTRAP